MAVEIVLPLFLRLGDSPEAHVGDITLSATSGTLELPELRTELAAALREAAAVMESPSDDEEVPDAPA